MCYDNCRKLIEASIYKLNSEAITKKEYQEFKKSISEKLDVFLKNKRITKDQYNKLAESLKEV